MRSDIAPGGTFPDYELPDHENVPRKLSEIQGEDPLILTLARGQLLPQGAPAAPRARRQLPQDRGGLHEDRHHLDRHPSSEPGVPRVDRRPVALPLRPGADRPEGPRNPGVHRPRARPDDPPHARAQARAGRPQHLQRLLVLGTSVVRRSVARPARGDPRDPPRLGSQQARAARSVGCGRLLAFSRMGQALPSGAADVLPRLKLRLPAVAGSPTGSTGWTTASAPSCSTGTPAHFYDAG